MLINEGWMIVIGTCDSGTIDTNLAEDKLEGHFRNRTILKNESVCESIVRTYRKGAIHLERSGKEEGYSAPWCSLPRSSSMSDDCEDGSYDKWNV